VLCYSIFTTATVPVAATIPLL